MSTRKQRMQALKEWLAVNPLYTVEIPSPDGPFPTTFTCRCAVHAEGLGKKTKVAIYKMTNVGQTYRRCGHPGCTYRIESSQLP